MPQMAIAEFARDKDGATRDIAMIVNESILNECQEARQMVWFADLSIEKAPMMVSNWTVPEAKRQLLPARRPLWRAFLQREHGTRSSQEDGFHRLLQCRGARPRHPQSLPAEGGRLFHPGVTEKTDKRCVKVDGQDRCKTAIQNQHVETDARGYIYIVDRANTGMHILELGARRARWRASSRRRR